MKQVKLQSGFTIIEVVVAVGLFALVGVMVVELVSSILSGSNKQSVILADTDQARKISYSFTSEIRDAQTSNTGAYALASASSTEIIFYSNIDSDALIERVRYYLSNGKIYKGIIEPTGAPLTYNSGSETVTTVQSNVVNTSAPLFTYYNDTYNGSGTALTSPVNVTHVRYVQINMQIANRAGVSTTNYFTVSAGGTMRNLKTNLGD